MKAMAKNLVGLNYDDIDEQKDENMIKRWRRWKGTM
jgi:hypothetical protein